MDATSSSLHTKSNSAPVPLQSASQAGTDLVRGTNAHLAALAEDSPPDSYLAAYLQRRTAHHAAVLDATQSLTEKSLANATNSVASLAVVLRSPAFQDLQNWEMAHERALLRTIEALQKTSSTKGKRPLPSLTFTDEACHQHLINWTRARPWSCAVCGDHRRYFLESRLVYECQCGRQTSLLSGTLFEGSHVPLRIWFMVVVAVACGWRVSATDLADHLQYRRIQTIRGLMQAVKDALRSDQAETLLAGIPRTVEGHLCQLFPGEAATAPTAAQVLNSEMPSGNQLAPTESHAK